MISCKLSAGDLLVNWASITGKVGCNCLPYGRKQWPLFQDFHILHKQNVKKSSEHIVEECTQIMQDNITEDI